LIFGKGLEKEAKGGDKSTIFWSHFGPKSIKNAIGNSKVDLEKTWKIKPKGPQNGSEFDAKTHQQSMPKLISKKSRKIMKIMFF